MTFGLNVGLEDYVYLFNVFKLSSERYVSNYHCWVISLIVVFEDALVSLLDDLIKGTCPIFYVYDDAEYRVADVSSEESPSAKKDTKRNRYTDERRCK